MRNKETFIGLDGAGSHMKDKKRAVCVVCDMIVSKKTHFTARFKGKTYYFCCDNCKSSFIGNPNRYTLG